MTDSPNSLKSAPYKNPQLPTEERVADLLKRMTREEKIGQLGQMLMRDYKEKPEEYQAGARAGRWGSRIVAEGGWGGMEENEMIFPELLNELQRVAVEESRLGIPLLYGRDVIYGHRTVLPIPLAQAATWNPALCESGITCIAREAAAEGLHWTFAPMMDVTRDPRWGRVIETYGEDPWLASRFAEAAVHGFQGDDPSAPDRLLACAKHFCGYGGSEGGRDYDTAEWSENTLHNMILPPFRAAVEAGVATMMSSFNDLGGTPVSGSRALIRDWLKTELGWDGFVVSDWGSIWDLVGHGVAEDRKDAARIAFNAGVDMEMTADSYEKYVSDLIDEGHIPEEFLDDAVRRILRAKFRGGLFDHPYVNPEKAAETQRREEHLKIAREVVGQSLVLLKNQDDILPLPKEGLTVAVVGPYAAARRQPLGSWCLDGRRSEVTTILEGIRQVAPDLKLKTIDDPEFTDEMIKAAMQADLTILCVGESHHSNGENSSTTDLQMPPGQEELIKIIGRRGKPLVVVLCNGRPLPSEAAELYATAIVQAWNGGTEFGLGVADVLFGNVNPSGRLPISIPRNAGQVPIYYNRKMPGKVHQFGSPHTGYRDDPWDPLYPFGYGLSYTQFAYGNLTLSATELGVDGEITASVEVENIGDLPGHEVVQLYIQDPVASTARPVRELKGFQKIYLEPGELKTVTFPIEASRHLSFYTANRKWETEPGLFRVWIGADSRAPLGAEFRVTG